MSGLIIDNFAGGGGASTGIEAALGRPVDVAINHDPQAVAMHRANHPGTLHYCQSVWRADPLEVTKGRPVALAWFSPDCKHFSKAKGGKPVEKNIRDLAWVVALWAKRVRPAVIMLENVEEFKTWGPLTDDGMPCPDRRGHTFRMWKREFTRRGYRFEMRELVACDYGDEALDPAPTIRKRLFIIMRCDGLPIVWPERTHGPADHPDVIAGKLKPWRVAAGCIDWSLPCPSIFDSSETIKALYGVRAQRPLADATLRRVARGVMKYVVEAARPFIVPNNTNNVPSSIDAPLPTVTTGGRNILVTPSLIQMGYGEHPGQPPRVLDLDKPLGTVVAGGNKHALVASFLAQHNTAVVGHGADEPVSTLTSKPGPQGVVAVHMTYAQQGGLNRPADAPMHTLTASAKDQNAVVAASMLNLRGSDRRDVSIDAPLRTVSAGGNHAAVVGAFLAKYYGAGDPSQGCDEPMHTVTAKPRHGLVTVQVDGETFAIADIGMRMLTPRERFRAQGFPDSYVIDHGIDENGQRVKLSLDAQGRMCGNSVCPPLAAALVRANVAAAEQAVAA